MERWRGKGNEGAEGARQGRGELKKEEGVGRWGCCGLYVRAGGWLGVEFISTIV